MRLALQGQPVLQVLLVPQEVQVLRVLQALREPTAQYLDLRDQLVLRALQGQLEPQALLVQRVPQVPLDLQVQQDLLGQQVRLVLPVQQEQAQRRFPTS